MHFRSRGPTEFSFWILHRNALTERAWKDTGQALGQEISRISRYTLHLVSLLSFVFLIEEECPQPRLVNLVFSRKNGFFECSHLFIDKPTVITVPAVESTHLLGLGLKLCPGILVPRVTRLNL